MIAAVVPVKTLSASKSRLLPDLSRDDAARLCLAMLSDVLAALSGVPELGRIAVATPDERVARAAKEAGAEALLCPDPGLNRAVEAAGAELAPGNADGLLVVLGDVAGARSEDLRALVQICPTPGVALAPSSDGGTSALLRRPRDVIPAAFGPGSARAHRESADRVGVRLFELPLPSLALDIDSREDLERFAATDSGGAHTRALLRQLSGT